METIRERNPPTPAVPFKSYYVVWKRKRYNAAKRTYARFKSYYVVWKHNKLEMHK